MRSGSLYTYLIASIFCILLQGCDSASMLAESPLVSQARMQGFHADLIQHIGILASDEFEGRAPATPGGRKTVQYLQEQFRELGLAPGNSGSYLQEVPISEVTTNSNTSLLFNGDGYHKKLLYGSDMMVSAGRHETHIKLQDSEVIFVGYGINAPERGWNDYQGLDVKGKTLVMLVNDPGFITQDPEHFNGNAMTYYGRWTYKYEEAARQGAVAAFVIHETAPAAYPWAVVKNSWSGPQISLSSADAPKLAIQGWLTLAAAKSLLRAAGQDYQALKHAAARPGFKPFALNVRASISIHNKIRHTHSNNVIAYLPGTTDADEYLVYMAHWDHLGRDASRTGDQIYNGAADNATGTAALLALARAHKEHPSKRSLVFIAVTAEESGLLGSEYYAQNPVFPLAKTVAVLNMDGLSTIGRVKDVVVVGYGFNQLQDTLAKYVARQGRYLAPDHNANKGYYFRSDHFSLARYGVPGLYAEGGIDSRAHGKEWGRNRQDEYTRLRYHKPADEFDHNMDLTGAAEDVELYFYTGYELSNNQTWPQWHDSSEFKKIREESRGL